MHIFSLIFKQSPEIALFISLALGYLVGKVKFGSFQLGGVAGSLLAAVVISQAGVEIDNGVKAILFALFIYAVGFESGPQFFRSLGKNSFREILMATILAISGLATVVILAKVMGLDKGLAAGIAAGGLTQSAIIGTAGSAIQNLGLAANETQRLQSNVAIGYAVTYIVGSLGAIIICVNVLPWLMKRRIRDDAVKAQALLLNNAKVYSADETPALPELVGRIYRIGSVAAGKSISEVEALSSNGYVDIGDTNITVERIKRNGKIISVEPNLKLVTNDLILIIGRRNGVIDLEDKLGTEVSSSDGMELVVTTQDIEVRAKEFINHTVADTIKSSGELRHGIYLLNVTRDGKKIDTSDDTIIKSRDIITVHGAQEDLQRLAERVGPAIMPSDKTDFVFHGIGIALGLLTGLIVIHIHSMPLTLGSGGGALLSGIVFGWYKSRHMTIGNMPTGASTLLKDLGLAGFVAVVGLQSGKQAISTIMQSGMSIFVAGVIVTIVPLLITMVIGRYILKYDNVAILAGALSGSRSANPAFGEVLAKAGNSVPTTPFAITYAIANVFLTLLGPLIVALV